MSRGIYRTLDNSMNEIRLLVPTASPEPGTCWNLTIFAIDASPPFAALSYLWGDSTERVDITVNGQSTSVTATLACALKHVEQHWRRSLPARDVAQFHLWTDALCINQSDIAEREQQVQLMGRLYSTAEIVLGSFGPSTEAIKVAIDTLHLVHSEIIDEDEDKTLGKRLEWMQKYPGLTEADVGLPEDQFDANKSWKLLREFLYMQYWRRAWVFQEVVLAKELLFFSETQTLNPEALFATLSWFKAMKELAKNEDARRPHWLIPSIWNFVTYDNLLGWKAVLRMEWARSADRKTRFFKLLLACSGNDLRATDPRDLIYGTMGLTKMDLEPDYSPASSLAELYVTFMAWWFEQVTAWQAEDPDWTLDHLDLLGEAGIGQVDEGGENMDLARSIPSWVPNFPLQAKIYTPHILTTQQNADTTVFPADAPLPRAQGLSLLVPIVILDSITNICKVKEEKKTHGLLSFVVSYVEVHKTYPNGSSSLQGLFRTLMKDILNDTDPQDRDVMIRFFGFIRALIHGPETGIIAMEPEEALQRLGFSTASNSQFAESVRNIYLPSMDPETLEWTEKWFRPLLQSSWDGEWQNSEVLDLCLRTVLETRELDYTCIATTSKGYLSVAAIGTKVGDQVCLLHRSRCASVIRERSDHWEHVGRCYSYGLSECRSKELMNHISAYRVLEIR